MGADTIIKEFLAEKGWSRTDLAEELGKRFYRPGRGKRPRSARSLAQEIRKLEAGDTKWFQRRPDAARALAEILECRTLDVGIHDGEGLVTFGGLAATPLDLAREDPFDAAGWRSVFENIRREPIWICAGPGTGKTVISRWAAVRGLAARVEATTLSNAAQAAQGLDGPVVLDVARVDDTDLAIIAQLSQRARLVVFAPAPRPTRASRSPSGDGGPAWLDVDWSARAFDAHAFLAWVCRRIPDEPHIGDMILQRLDAFDPDHVLVSTPLDAIQYAEAVMEDRRASSLGDAVVRRAIRLSDSHWLRAHARGAFRSLAIAAWRDTRFVYGATAPLSTWAERVPEELLAPRDHASFRAALKALRAEAKPDVDEVAARLRADATTTVSLLEQAGLLFKGADARLELRPKWLAHADVVEFLGATLEHSPGDACAPALDASRRVVLDRVVAHLRDKPFFKFVTSTLAGKADDVGSVAAIETAFTAIAHRGSRGQTIPPRTTMEQLLRRQMNTLVDRYEGAPRGPLTRPGPQGVGGNAFVADCWWWSVHVDEAADGDAWLFPSPSNQPSDEPSRWLHGMDTVGGQEAIGRLSSALDAMLDRWEPRAWPSAPAWMLPSLLGARRAWPLPASAAQMLQDERVAIRVRAAIERLDHERRARAVGRLWSLAATCALDGSTRILGTAVGELMLARLEPAAIEDALSTWAQIAAQDLGRIPHALRSAIVHHALTRGLAAATLLWSQVEHLDERDTESLVRIAELPHGWLAVARLWTVAPDVARAELERRVDNSDDTAAHWLEAPNSATSTILDVLGRRRGEPPTWLRRWAARQMLAAPWEAERLLPLARAERAGARRG